MKRNLILILLVSAVLRLFQLSSFPPHLRNDEAALGYNAYSIIKTLKDEHRKTLPILFQSFGDWKPGLYIYLTIPFILIFGLTDIAVRLTGAISGVFAVFLIYVLSLQIFKERKIATYSAFLLAIAPWHIAFSRGAWEAQVTVTLTLAALIFFFKALEKENRFLLISVFLFGSTFLMSHSAKASTPLVIIPLFISFRKELLKIKPKILLFSLLLFTIISFPVIFSFINGKNTRVASLFYFSNINNYGINTQVEDIGKKWLDHFSLQTLFLNGDGNPQHSASEFGALMIMDVFLFLFGIVYFFQQNIKKEVSSFILLWFLLAPFSSSLAKEGVNFVRFLNIFIPITFILALGVCSIRKKALFPIFIALYLVNFIIFLDAYFIHAPKKTGAWQYGYKQMVDIITPIQKYYQKIYIPQSSDQAYIFFLFYQKYSPHQYQKRSLNVSDSKQSSSGMDQVSSLDNIEFVDFNTFEPPQEKNSLIIVPVVGNYPVSNYEYKTLYEIKDTLGFPIYRIVSNKQ